MKILVTGSSGKLGSVTVKLLRDFGHKVIGADIADSETRHVITDVKNRSQVFEITQGVDAVIHTAALHGRHMDLNYSREDFVNTNINGTLNLLNACVANGVSKFLFTSSTSIYGKSLVDDKQAVWVDENLALQPRDIYDITKQTCEELCREFFEKEGIQAMVYRVGRFLPEPDNLKLNHRLYRGLDERDGAEALRLALDHNFEQFEVFNVSSGSPFHKEDLIELKHNAPSVIAKYYPEALELYKKNNWKLPESIDRVYRCDKGRHVLNYQPKYTFEYLLNEHIKR
ncbi:MAG: NAD(P)-dependent oxidoreductase [Candidatus Pedobacter colombiensis]|uniref:NAD(P)-dependent oxidoreductase n=1 Tax=Candidatus Pedobacter colombiensis TaxID=3121371 RepID=A0AAJ6B7B1_9SPHI|nr:NAD(P)-dependent oxidoreductase [Pedobacter sp.]WEK20912.1 MAG: NAD(P)-dependent oxidoreductase [Pedobacter sp.]